MASTTITVNDNDDWVFPLLLSCMAGASTCVGAAVVFCFSPQQIRQSMSFSLSLAASVMITVSVISIGPECWHGIVEAADNDDNNSLAAVAASYKVNVWLLVERLLAFGGGCGGYFLLSKVLGSLPDPEHLFLFGSSKGKEGDAAGSIVSPGNTGVGKKGEEEDDEEHMEPLQLRRVASEDSAANSTASFESEFGNGYARERDALLTAPVAGKPSKHSNNHRLRRKMTTQTSDGSPSRNYVRDRTIHTALSNDGSLVLESGNSMTTTESYDKDDIAKQQQKQRSWRVAMLLFFSLLAHNFPEGLCVAASAKESPQLGITVAIGIFIHNVPEGIAISVPCIVARPESPWLAFWLASISGLAEPIGAIVALLVLRTTKLELENVLASVAGVMCMVAAMELYPEAVRQLSVETGSLEDSKKALVATPSTPSYRSIVWGTLVGMGMMIATEWYLPS